MEHTPPPIPPLRSVGYISAGCNPGSQRKKSLSKAEVFDA